MKIERIRQNKKALKVLLSNGFRQPFQILVDSVFVKVLNSLENGPSILKETLQSYPKYFISKCEFEKYKKNCSEIKTSDFSGQCEIIKCNCFKNDSSVDSKTNCYSKLICPENPNHYILATTSLKRISEFKEHNKLPILKIIKWVPFVDCKRLKRIKTVYKGDKAGEKELRRLREKFGEADE